MSKIVIRQYLKFAFSLERLAEDIDKMAKISGNTTKATLLIDGQSDLRIKVVGSGLKYDGKGYLKSGTVTEVTIEVKGTNGYARALEFSNFTLDVSRAVNDTRYDPFKTIAFSFDASKFVGTDFLGVVINGTERADTLKGSVLNDQIFGNGGKDKIFGLAGDDRFMGGDASVAFDGGSGVDMVDYTEATGGVTVDLRMPARNTGLAAGDSYVLVESVSGTPYADAIYGDSGDNTLLGWHGKDSLSGSSGNDTLWGGQGADTLIGGSGNDTASYQIVLPYNFTALPSVNAGVTVDLLDASKNTGDAKGDTFSSIENVTGTGFADKLYGDSKANVLIGNGSNDILSGRGGNDVIRGDFGADKLHGGSGADTFVYLLMYDSMVGSQDHIADFRRSDGDKIDLSGVNPEFYPRDLESFTFIGKKAFSGKGGEVRFEGGSDGVHVQVDVAGSGRDIDMSIFLEGVSSLSRGDFIL